VIQIAAFEGISHHDRGEGTFAVYLPVESLCSKTSAPYSWRPVSNVSSPKHLVAPGTRSLVSSSFLRIYEEGERIPVTIESSDPERGPVNIDVESAAKNHAPAELARNRDQILDVVGPRGKPSEIANYGTVVVVGGGVGA